MLHKKATAGKTFSYNFRYANPAHNDLAIAVENLLKRSWSTFGNSTKKAP